MHTSSFFKFEKITFEKRFSYLEAKLTIVEHCAAYRGCANALQKKVALKNMTSFSKIEILIYLLQLFLKNSSIPSIF